MEVGADRLFKQKKRERGQNIPFSGKYIAILNTKQLRTTTLGLHKIGFINSQTRTEEGLVEPYPSLLNYFLWIESGKWGITPSVVYPLVTPRESSRLSQSNCHIGGPV